MKKEIFPRLIISIFTLLLFPVLNIYAQTTPFFVMNLQRQGTVHLHPLNSWFGNTTTNQIIQSNIGRFYGD
ncbi:MAG: hypothetical protein IPN18_14405 [Ignavibacteriales bacterium]|nr:hypothetical protein [Ignavibacteriales bacterium]